MHVCNIDIETMVIQAPDWSNAEKAQAPVVMITLLDEEFGEYLTWSYHPKRSDMVLGEEFNESDATLYLFKDEKDMLAHFASWFGMRQFDYIIGWNIEGFDIPYLIGRMKRLGVDHNMMSPLGICRDGRVLGTPTVDLLQVYKKLMIEDRSFKLVDVARDECGMELDKDYSKLNWEWENKLIDLWLYNCNDVLAVKAINDKLGLLDYWVAMSHVTGSRVVDQIYASKPIESLILRSRTKEEILPSKDNDARGRRFEGAYVFPTTPGIHENIMVLDLARIYPNIIKSCNMCITTLSEVIADDSCGHLKLKEKYVEIGNGHYFDKSKEGILPRAVNQVFKLRDDFEARGEWEKVPAIKAVINSLYGVLGNPYFRMYRHEIASSVTHVGRNILFFIKDILDRKGYEIVAGDTDSVMVLAKTSDFLAEGRELEEIITDSFGAFAAGMGISHHTFTLEFEKNYEWAFFSPKRGNSQEGAKKKYAGMVNWKKGKHLEESKLDVKGFEYVRSDSAEVTQSVQGALLTHVLSGAITKESINDILAAHMGLIVQDNFEYFMMPKGIKKPLHKYGRILKSGKRGAVPIHVRAAEYSNQFLGTEFGPGDKPCYLMIAGVTNTNKYPPTDVIAVERGMTLPPEFVVDLQVMREKTVLDKVDEILQSVGYYEDGENDE
jgi:DNA polymerase elongation subunit (family B)